jgi:5'-deoxynucleotidase YfbR-like HD superfamily hydrolase
VSIDSPPAASNGARTHGAHPGAPPAAPNGAAAPPAGDPDAPAVLPELVPLVREFTTLKRVHAAGRPGSWASRGFARAWGRLAAGQPPAEVARMELVAAVVATRLGAIDAEFLAAERVPPTQAYRTLRRGWMAAITPLPPGACRALRATAGEGAGGLTSHIAQTVAALYEVPLPVPAFVARLAEQPRAGPTRPDTPRLMLVPTESHAEHCWAVAVTGALLAGAYGAEVTPVFLAGLAHHLPNAWLPDGGDAADVALDGALDELLPTLRARALAELGAAPRAAVEAALAIPPATGTPEARAFHAADALDRVLEMEWFARAAAFTLDDALAERPGAFDVLHPGPNQAVERAALRAAGLLPAATPPPGASPPGGGG